ncbi:3'-5' exonuclease [Enterobacter ludwigii]|uniref:3'-5' exonuclease n=1 Tax=Enterobacter ludwigii TaxID=299767 RepID=UPI003BEECF0B
MQHIAISLSAMDTYPTAAITTIAAVAFNPETGDLGNTFYEVIDLESSEKMCRSIGGAKVKEWLRKGPEERSEILSDRSTSIRHAMSELENFILRNSHSHTPHIWMREAHLTAPALLSTMNCTNIQGAWMLHNLHSTDTLEYAALSAGINASVKVILDRKYNTLSDAIHQTGIITHIWQHLIKPRQQESQL